MSCDVAFLCVSGREWEVPVPDGFWSYSRAVKAAAIRHIWPLATWYGNGQSGVYAQFGFLDADMALPLITAEIGRVIRATRKAQQAERNYLRLGHLKNARCRRRHARWYRLRTCSVI